MSVTKKKDKKRTPCDYIINNNTSFYKLKTVSDPIKQSALKTIMHDLTDNNIMDITFWKIIHKLNWRDRSELICNRRTLSKLTTEEQYFLKIYIISYFDELQNVIKTTGIFTDSYFNIPENVLNFIYHIIAKGREFYNVCIIEPTFCEYILGEMEVQNLHTFLNEIC